jgi:hypothetical protein
VGGWTNARDFPVSPGAYDGRSRAPDADFIVKLSADGGRVVYSSLLDGASFGIYSLVVDSAGGVYAAGSTSSSRMPITGPALQPCPGSTNLVLNFLLKLNPAGSAPTYLSFEDASQQTRRGEDRMAGAEARSSTSHSDGTPSSFVTVMGRSLQRLQ